VLRATTHLGDAQNERFVAWVTRLQRDGLDVQIVEGSDAHLDADIVFACGLLTALAIRTHGERQIIAAPIFAGEYEASYRSVIVARTDSELRNLRNGRKLRLSINEYASWSGWHGFKEHLRHIDAAPGTIAEHVLSGSHVSSLDALLDARADVACIDHTIWETQRRVDPRLSALRVIDTTRDWPAPPLSIRSSLAPEMQTKIVDLVANLSDVVAVDGARYSFMLAEIDEHPTQIPQP
jgi:ABC-type phosphate/phosphonate transport system substrate-binding protein